jgi:uncharacterized protein (TIGR02266 family)
MKTRAHLRVPLPMPVKIKVLDRDQEFKLTALGDISWGGVFVMMNPPAPMGARVLLQFVVSETNVSLELWGTVVRTRTNGKAEPSGVGIEFDPMDEDSRSLIQQLVHEEIMMLVKNCC